MELKNEFSWSKSRDGIFRECRRKYWFNCYGFWGGWDSFAGERTKRIYYLKQLRSKEVWLGSLIHGVVEFVLRRFRTGERISLGSALSIFRSKFDDGFLSSSLKEYSGFPSKAHKFFEDEYGIGISDENKDAMLKKGELCISNFFNSDIFMEIRRTPIEDWITLEDFLFFDFEGTKVFLSVDFAMKKGGKILLYDWKTGIERVADIDLQLSCYVLYFADRFGVSASEIEARVFNLGLDKVDVFDIDDERLEKMKNYIRDSVGDMRSLLDDVDGNIASEGKFEKWFEGERGMGVRGVGASEGQGCVVGKDFKEGACGRCVFRKVCLGDWA